MEKLLKGKPVADKIKKEILEASTKLKEKGITPTMGIIRVGNRSDDLAYENGIKKNCESVGISVEIFEYDIEIPMDKFTLEVERINLMENIHGILIFRPLPKQLDIEKIKTIISPQKDIDAMHPDNLRKIFEGEEDGFCPCTPQAVIEILKHYEVELEGANVVVVNRSMVLGKPLAMLLLKENATVTICHSKTKDIKEATQKADIIVTGVGRANFFNEEYFTKDSIVIDVGINYENNKMCGDVDFGTVEPIVKKITPVPGGVGTVTTSILLKHVIDAIQM